MGASSPLIHIPRILSPDGLLWTGRWGDYAIRNIRSGGSEGGLRFFFLFCFYFCLCGRMLPARFGDLRARAGGWRDGLVRIG